MFLASSFLLLDKDGLMAQVIVDRFEISSFFVYLGFFLFLSNR